MSFSVLMSVYAKEQPAYLSLALESVFRQSLPPDEVILVEDGKLTEGLYEVIRKQQMLHPELKAVQLEENQQLGRALRIGLGYASHELVARMDADDIAVGERFEVQCRYMDSHPEVAAVGGYIQEFDDSGTWEKVKEMPLGEEEIRHYMRYRNPLNHMTVMFRKKAVIQAGNYEHFPFLEDYYLWCRMYAQGAKLANLPDVLVCARTSGSMFQRRGGFAYCRRYLKFRGIQRKLGITNRWEYLVGCALSIAISLQPGWLRKRVYGLLLRRGQEENG